MEEPNLNFETNTLTGQNPILSSNSAFEKDSLIAGINLFTESASEKFIAEITALKQSKTLLEEKNALVKAENFNLMLEIEQLEKLIDSNQPVKQLKELTLNQGKKWWGQMTKTQNPIPTVIPNKGENRIQFKNEPHEAERIAVFKSDLNEKVIELEIQLNLTQTKYYEKESLFKNQILELALILAKNDDLSSKIVDLESRLDQASNKEYVNASVQCASIPHKVMEANMGESGMKLNQIETNIDEDSGMTTYLTDTSELNKVLNAKIVNLEFNIKVLLESNGSDRDKFLDMEMKLLESSDRVNEIEKLLYDQTLNIQQYQENESTHKLLLSQYEKKIQILVEMNENLSLKMEESKIIQPQTEIESTQVMSNFDSNLKLQKEAQKEASDVMILNHKSEIDALHLQSETFLQEIKSLHEIQELNNQDVHMLHDQIEKYLQVIEEEKNNHLNGNSSELESKRDSISELDELHKSFMLVKEERDIALINLKDTESSRITLQETNAVMKNDLQEMIESSKMGFKNNQAILNDKMIIINNLEETIVRLKEESTIFLNDHHASQTTLNGTEELNSKLIALEIIKINLEVRIKDLELQNQSVLQESSMNKSRVEEFERLISELQQEVCLLRASKSKPNKELEDKHIETNACFNEIQDSIDSNNIPQLIEQNSQTIRQLNQEVLELKEIISIDKKLLESKEFMILDLSKQIETIKTLNDNSIISEKNTKMTSSNELRASIQSNLKVAQDTIESLQNTIIEGSQRMMDLEANALKIAKDMELMRRKSSQDKEAHQILVQTLQESLSDVQNSGPSNSKKDIEKYKKERQEYEDKSKREKQEAEDKSRKEKIKVQLEVEKYKKDCMIIEQQKNDMMRQYEKEIQSKVDELAKERHRHTKLESDMLLLRSETSKQVSDSQKRLQANENDGLVKAKAAEHTLMNHKNESLELERSIDIIKNLQTQIDTLNAELNIQKLSNERSTKLLFEKDETLKKLRQNREEIVITERNLKRQLEKSEFELEAIKTEMIRLIENKDALEFGRSRELEESRITLQSVTGASKAIEGEILQLKIERDALEEKIIFYEAQTKSLSKKNSIIIKDLQKQVSKERRGSKVPTFEEANSPISSSPKSRVSSLKNSNSPHGSMPGVDFEDKRQLTDQLMAMISENESLNQRVHFITQEMKSLSEKYSKEHEETEQKSRVIQQYVLREHASKLQPDPKPGMFNLSILSSTSAMQRMDPVMLSQINTKLQKLLEELSTRIVLLEQQQLGK